MALIERVNVGGVVYDIASTAYAVSSQGATETAKVITMDGFTLNTGVTIHVKFANANTAANPTLTINGTGSTGNSPIPISGITNWPAGALLTLTYDGTNWVRDYDETISNNVTGSGTSGSLAKFNGTNTITDGPALTTSYNSSTTVTASHKFLREDGTWVVPKYTTNTDEKVKQTGITTDGAYPILLKNTTGTSDVTAAAVNFGKTTNKVVTINPSTGAITAPGGLVGNASSATAFASAQSVALTGDVTGSASSTAGWSITTTIGEGKVTNAMLAGSIANGKLVNSKITIAGQQVSLGGSIDAATLRTQLGLTQALRFVGSTSTVMYDGYTGTPAGISIYSDANNPVAPAVGDVVLDSSNNAEYACISVSGTTYTWEILGAESSWALSNDVIHVSGTKGDILYWSDTNTPAHLAKGSDNAVLKLSNGVPVWGTDSDTKVTQAYSTSNSSYPLLFSNTAGVSSTSSRGATTALVNNAIYANPSTGTLYATKFSGDGSSLTNVAASSVDWSNVQNKVLSTLYVNATSGGAASNAATDNNTTYIHLYDNSAKQATIQLKGAGGASVAATNTKVITITSLKYKSAGSASALTSLKLKYTDNSTSPATAHDDAVSSATATPTALGVVAGSVLYIKSMYYGTTSVSTGVTTDS